MQDAGSGWVRRGCCLAKARGSAPPCVPGGARRDRVGETPRPTPATMTALIPCPRPALGGDNGHLSPGAGAWHWAGASAGGPGRKQGHGSGRLVRACGSGVRRGRPRKRWGGRDSPLPPPGVREPSCGAPPNPSLPAGLGLRFPWSREAVATETSVRQSANRLGAAAPAHLLDGGKGAGGRDGAATSPGALRPLRPTRRRPFPPPSVPGPA